MQSEKATITNISDPHGPASLTNLAKAFAEKKKEVKAVQSDLEILHKQIIQHPSVIESLPEKGTTQINENLKIVTGVTENWNQAKLAVLASEIDPGFFPFKIEYKKDAKAFSVFEDRWPDLAKKLTDALTTKPRKATIEVIL